MDCSKIVTDAGKNPPVTFMTDNILSEPFHDFKKRNAKNSETKKQIKYNKQQLHDLQHKFLRERLQLYLASYQ